MCPVFSGGCTGLHRSWGRHRSAGLHCRHLHSHALGSACPVYLADPARGNVRTPISEFLEQWQKNAVLVVVKRNVQAEKESPLLVRPEEISLGKLNRLYVRKRLESFTPVLP